ncbi:CIA30 family protein [Glaciecola sp. MH2013]|nr:CIA30 family protein [Glaciecola sp. MH2013]
MSTLLAMIPLIHSELHARNEAGTNNGPNLITFDKPEHAGRWARVNDSVMGGVSTSTIYLEDDFGVFSGNLSLENNGGFASVRRLWTPTTKALNNESKPAKVKIKVLGDGQYYQLRFRTSKYMDGVSYAAGFQSKEGEMTEHEFELNDFVAVWRGRTVRDAEKLAWDDIAQVGIMITQKQKGPFTLKVASIALSN